MKTTKYIALLLLSVVVFGSCESWLDVAPGAQMKEDDQFATEQGFKDALYGVYTLATDPSLYGDNLTMGMLSVMSYCYSNQSSYGSYFYAAATYDYTNAGMITWIDNIWNKSYSAIAHINLILKNIEQRRSVMSQQVYNTIKGEMLGMRAYLHFDLYRLFAPAYTQAEDLDALAVPYRDQFGIQAAAPLTVREFPARVLQDLSEAATLLSGYKEIDQLNKYIGAAAVTGDDFMLYRQNRFNYWAAKALEARVNLYIGQKTAAATAAAEVINSGKFHLFTSEDAANTDYVFTPEMIFALYDSKLQERSDYYFSERLSHPNGEPDRYLRLSTTRLNSLYQTNAGGSSDMRYVRQWSASGANTYCNKYWQLESMNIALKFQIPLIKLGEMYLILAEANSDPEPLNDFREARNLSRTVTASTLADEIAREYQKEMFAEGQSFFYFKRMGVGTLPNSWSAAKYVLPIPENELIYGEY